MSRSTVFCVFLIVFAVPSTAEEIKIHGYVTNIESPDIFDIDDYHIRHAQSLVLDLEKADSEEKAPFRAEDIRVGTEMEIKGDCDRKTGDLRATSIKVFSDDLHKVKRTAVIERPPELRRGPNGWEGTIFADGQRIRLNATTHVQFKPNRSESQEIRERAKATREHSRALRSAQEEGDDPYHNPATLESLDQIGPDTFITYEGRRQGDGSIAASQVQFVRSEVEKGEAKLWDELEPTFRGGSLAEGRSRQIHIRNVGTFRLVRNKEVQSYVTRIGESLVPEFQRNMAEDDPNKIQFRFYVVQSKEPNAFALANGVVVVQAPMFSVVENEAQLAAVLGHEISHTIEKHTWRELHYHKKALSPLHVGGIVAAAVGANEIEFLTDMMETTIRSGYSRSLENQADREGMQNMMAAGYDPREAANVWKAMARAMGDTRTNLFWSDHDNFTTRRSYLMAELRNNYAGVDFSGLKKDSDEFEKIRAAVPSGARTKRKIRVQY